MKPRGSPGDTIREMHAAFRRGGRKAIETVMRNQPAVFLKLLVLLVPREMKLEHSGGVKAMTDEEIERGIELIKAMWSGKLRPMPKSFQACRRPEAAAPRCPRRKVSLSKSP